MPGQGKHASLDQDASLGMLASLVCPIFIYLFIDAITVIAVALHTSISIVRF